MKQLTKTQLNEISDQILNELIKPTPDSVYQQKVAQGEEDLPYWQQATRKYGENSTTIWLWALGIGTVVGLPALRYYVSKRLRKGLVGKGIPKDVQITEGMRIRYLIQDMLAKGALSKLPIFGQWIAGGIPEYLEALKKQIKKEAKASISVLNNPKASRAEKDLARDFITYIEDVPENLAKLESKMVKTAINDFYTKPDFDVDQLLKLTGWEKYPELALRTRVRMPILKNIHNKLYKLESIPYAYHLTSEKFSKYYMSRPHIQNTFKELYGNKLDANQLYNKYLGLVNKTTLNHDAIDAYYNASGHFPGYHFWMDIQQKSGATDVSYKTFKKQYLTWTISRFGI